jgi:hypothetical protein
MTDEALAEQLSWEEGRLVSVGEVLRITVGALRGLRFMLATQRGPCLDDLLVSERRKARSSARL